MSRRPAATVNGSGVSFSFDAVRHEYLDTSTGEVLPSITGLMERAGLVDSTWYTEASRDRGAAIHRLVAAYNLGGLDVASCDPAYRPYLLGYVAGLASLRPSWTAVEEPYVHPVWRFAGTPDGVGTVFKLQTVLEIKSGARIPGKLIRREVLDDGVVYEERGPEPHAVQTALQAILVSGSEGGLPAEDYQRLCIYLKRTGRYSLERHGNRHDFTVARQILDQFCGRAS